MHGECQRQVRSSIRFIKFFIIILDCEHCVCLECIRTWRTNSAETAKTCPICRAETYFVTPSTIWPTNSALKSKIIDEYRQKLSLIDCRHFNFGQADCPFSTSCFYRHADENGALYSTKLRHILSDDSAEGVQIMQEVKLADFLNFSRE